MGSRRKHGRYVVPSPIIATSGGGPFDATHRERYGTVATIYTSDVNPMVNPHLRKSRRVATLLSATLLLASFGLGISGPASAEPGTPLTPRVTTTDLGTGVHDLVVDGQSIWATLPGQNRVAELDTADLEEQRRILVGTHPRGIDLLDDGKLAIALEGATGYVEVDPATAGLETITLPLLGAPQTWDVANVGNNVVLVSSNPGSGGFAYIVRVDRSNNWSSTRVASQRIIRAGPRFADNDSTVLIGEGFSPNSLYRLDTATPTMPIVAEDNHGDVEGTERLAISPDGSRAYLSSGQVIRTSDIIPVGAIDPGYPVVPPTGSTVYSLDRTAATAFETATFSATATYDLTACGFTSDISAAVAPTRAELIVAAGTRICRIDLDVEGGQEYVPLTPCRILDTRKGGGGKLSESQVRSYQVGGTGGNFSAQGGQANGCGVPDGAAAVEASVTAVAPDATGFFRAWPADGPEPGATFLNFTKNQGTTNTGAITLAPSGTLDLKVKNFGGPSHYVIDIQGYFTDPAAAGSVYVPLVPCRVLDTRQGGGGIFESQDTDGYTVVGTGPDFEEQGGQPDGCGVPVGATAVEASVSAVAPGGDGFLRAWPGDGPEPGATFINFTENQGTTNTGSITLADPDSDAFDIAIKNFGGPSHYVIDVQGYFISPEQQNGSLYYPLQPCRVLDTRSGGGGTFAPNDTRDYQVAGTGAAFAAQGGKPNGCNIPTNATATESSITAVAPTGNGYTRAWPTNASSPEATFLNYTRNQGTTNTGAITLAPAAPDLRLKNFSGPTDYVIDTQGYYAAAPPA